MRIAGTHHGAAVFEDLDVVDVFQAGQFSKLFDPGADYQFDLVQRHGSEREIVTRREANHAANPGLRFGDKQAHTVDVETSVEDLRLQGGEVVLENERRWVRRISNPAGADVARAQVAIRIVGGL